MCNPSIIIKQAIVKKASNHLKLKASNDLKYKPEASMMQSWHHNQASPGHAAKPEQLQSGFLC